MSDAIEILIGQKNEALAERDALAKRVEALEDYILNVALYDYPNSSLLMKADEIAERRKGRV